MLAFTGATARDSRVSVHAPAGLAPRLLAVRAAYLRTGAAVLALVFLGVVIGRVGAGAQPLARLALLAAVSAACVMARRPAFALLLVVLAPLGPHAQRASLSLAAPLSETLVGLFLAVWLARAAWRGLPRVRFTPLDALLVTSLALASLSAAAAMPGRERVAGTAPSTLSLDAALFLDSPLGPCFPLRRLYTLIEGLALYAYARTRRPDDVRALLPWLALALAVVAAFGLVQYGVVDTSWRFRGQNRALSFLPGPNSFGSLLVLLLPLALHVARRERGRLERGVAAIALGCGLPALLLTHSRGAWLGLALAPLAWLLLARLARRGRRHAAAAVPAFALAAVLAVQAALSLAAGASRSQHESLNTAATGRYLLYLAAAEMMRAEPLTGIGLGNFDLQLEGHYPRFVVPREPHDHGHSLYFQLFAEQGVLGALPVLLALGLLLGTAARPGARPDEAPMVAALATAGLALLLHEVVDHTLLVAVIALFFWLVAGLLAACVEPVRAATGGLEPAGWRPAHGPFSAPAPHAARVA